MADNKKTFGESIKFFKSKISPEKEKSYNKRIDKTKDKYGDATEWISNQITQYISSWSVVIDRKMKGIINKNADCRIESHINKNLKDGWRHIFKIPLTKIMSNRVYENYYETQIPIEIDVKNPESNQSKQKLVSELSEHMNAYEYISTKTKDNGRVITDMGDGYGMAWATYKEETITVDENTGELADVVKDIEPHIKTLSPGTVLYPQDCKFDEITFLFVRFHESIRDCIERYRGLIDEKIYKELMDGLALHIAKSTDRFSSVMFENYERIGTYGKIDRMISDKHNDDKVGFMDISLKDFYTYKTHGSEDKGETVIYYDKNFDKFIVYFNKIPLFEIDNSIFGKINGGRRWHNIVKTSSDADPNTPISEGIPEKLISLQSMADSFFRKYMDNMALNAEPPLVTDGASTLENQATRGSRKRREATKIFPGVILQKTGGGEITKFPIGDVTKSSFGVVEYIFSLASILCYLSKYTGSGGGGIERSARGAQLMGDITERGVRLTENNSQYFARNSVMILFNDIYVKLKDKKIKISDDMLEINSLTDGNKNFELSVSFASETIRSFHVSRKLNNITQFLNAFGKFVGPGQHEDNKWLLNIRNLSDSMLDYLGEGQAKISVEEQQNVANQLENDITNAGGQVDDQGNLQLTEEQVQGIDELMREAQSELGDEQAEIVL